MVAAMDTSGDPGRVHEDGRVVRVLIEDARERVAHLVGVRPRQVVFTSGGTEAVNAAVFGLLGWRPVGRSHVRRRALGRARRVVTGRADRRAGGRADRADRPPVRLGGPRGSRAGTPRARALPVGQPRGGHHPTGRRDRLAVREAGVPVHVDACAAVGWVPTDLGALGADLVSISAHKCGGPAGVGALVIAPGNRYDPLMVGGQQERARRAGFENAPAIAGFGAVAELLAQGDRIEGEARANRVRVAQLLDIALAVEGVSIVGNPDPDGRLPHLVCLGVDGVEAEPVVIGLDRAGISVHSGSACSSESLEPSPVLASMGVDPERSLRLSVGWSTTDDDIGSFAAAFARVVTGLRALRNDGGR